MRLTDELCDCFEAYPEPNHQVADTCLTRVLPTERALIQKRYDLDMNRRGHRFHLAREISELLIERCPLLASFRPVTTERQLRWSDRPAAATVTRPLYTAPRRLPKMPPAVVSEAPPQRRASGVLLLRPGSRGLRLRTDEGQELYFELPAAAARKRDFKAGQRISLSYRREWRPAEHRIVPVVVAIDKN